MKIKAGNGSRKISESNIKKITEYLEKRNPDLFIDGFVNNWKVKVINPEFITSLGLSFENAKTKYYKESSILVNSCFYKEERNGNTTSCIPITSDELYELLDLLGLVKDILVEPNLQTNSFHYVI